MVSMDLYALTAFSSVLMTISATNGEALIWAKAVTFNFVMMFGALYETVHYLLPETVREPNNWKRYILHIELVTLAGVSAVLTNNIRSVSTGYAIDWGIGVAVAVGGSLLLVIGTVQKLLFYCRKCNSLFRKQAWLISLGMVLPFVIGVFTYVLYVSIGSKVPPLSVGFLFTIIFLGYTVVRYHMVFISPKPEEKVCAPFEARNLPEMDWGKGYLLETKTSDDAYGFFLRELEHGAEGLIITREHPDHVRERCHLANTPIIWLTTHPGPDRIEPSNISLLQHIITEFLRKGERPVLLLDGLEYLMVNDRFDKVVQMCQSVRDEVVIKDGIFIVSVDPDAFTTREIALLERDLIIYGVERPVQMPEEPAPIKPYADLAMPGPGN